MKTKKLINELSKLNMDKNIIFKTEKESFNIYDIKETEKTIEIKLLNDSNKKETIINIIKNLLNENNIVTIQMVYTKLSDYGFSIKDIEDNITIKELFTLFNNSTNKETENISYHTLLILCKIIKNIFKDSYVKNGCYYIEKDFLLANYKNYIFDNNLQSKVLDLNNVSILKLLERYNIITPKKEGEKIRYTVPLYNNKNEYIGRFLALSINTIDNIIKNAQ